MINEAHWFGFGKCVISMCSALPMMMMMKNEYRKRTVRAVKTYGWSGEAPLNPGGDRM